MYKKGIYFSSNFHDPENIPSVWEEKKFFDKNYNKNMERAEMNLHFKDYCTNKEISFLLNWRCIIFNVGICICDK